MLCKFCNQSDAILFPNTYRICYECYIHLSNCHGCKNNLFTSKSSSLHKENFESVLMFLVLQIFFYVLIT